MPAGEPSDVSALGHPALDSRRSQWDVVRDSVLDVVIVGGGINGASLFRELCSRGYRALVVDRGDFGGATSQSSAMWIWGGLLYLSYLDFVSVIRLCRGREEMLRDLRGWVEPRTFRCLSRRQGGRPGALMTGALYLYWLLGGFRRARPRKTAHYPESTFLDAEAFGGCLEYEEGCLSPSDARFVLQWILSGQAGQGHAFNYCELLAGSYDAGSGRWFLEVADRLLGTEEVIRARWVINAAGVWTDRLDARFRIQSPYRHVFSKGVFLAVPRPPDHQAPVVIDTGNNETSMALIPWGPVSLWGPTETLSPNLEEGFSITAGDVRFLLDELNRHLRHPTRTQNIVSLRCGVRPLALRRDAPLPGDPMVLSRSHAVHRDHHRPWISVYGGKITGSIPVARSVANHFHTLLEPSDHREERAGNGPDGWPTPPELDRHPGLSTTVPSPRWCAENELCWTLEDYLRRRTNIAQWVPRGGLGRNDEHVEHLVEIAGAFCANAPARARAAVHAYIGKIRRQQDSVLSACA